MMKKSLISRLFALAAMVIMASCTEKSPEYTNVIPADASAVVGIHIRSLIDKSGINDDDKQALIDAMKSELSAATFQQLENILKDASASGLSLKDPVYFFTGGPLPSVAAVIKMNDAEKFGKMLEALLPEVSDEPVAEADGYRLLAFGEGACAFNESVLLIIGSDYTNSIVSDLMKQSREESIAGNAYFKSMSDKKGDVTFFFTPDVLPYTYKRQLKMINGLEDVLPKDMAIIGGLSFEKGKIVLQVETASEKEEVREIFKKQNGLYNKLNATFLTHFPASTLVYMAFNIDGEKLYNALNDDENFSGSLPTDKAEKIKEVFDAFKGDVSIGLIDTDENRQPTFVAYAEAESGEALSVLCELGDELGLGHSIVKTGENRYVYNSYMVNIYFGYQDHYIYITNSESIGQNPGKSEERSLKDTDYASNIKGKRQYAVVNVKAFLELPEIKVLPLMEDGIFLGAVSSISYIEVAGEGDNRASMTIRLTDEDEGSLKQIVDLIRQFVGI
jgi:hypothetical protein